EIGIFLTNAQIETFQSYLMTLIKWNKEINLTAIENEKDIIIKHFLDSVSSSKFVNFSNKKVIDMGTGAGFPGLPLKIVFPNIEITFLDSSKKKMMVLDSICSSLGISGYKIVSDNIENIAHDIYYREKYDIVTTRAVADFRILLEYGIPFLKEKGEMIVYKGPNGKAEVENSEKALGELKAKIRETHEIILPFSDYKRTIILVEKIWKTNEKYPRRVGIPRKRPI
ncbi:MAG: 16S rRNA (guanine(527)-N(7))-methyltransferase RsmG, partial [Chlorobiales bacterium]|nr:16S rRNA (guanine(527)-N(7))-methyltransferase RsmG [Chlorobiales bacterium]